MKITRKDLTSSQIELTVEMDVNDIQPYLQHAASHISQHLNISGFRPGKAPYAMIKREIGEDKIFQEAIDDMINSSLAQAIREQGTYPYGDPKLDIKKAVPVNQFEYVATMDVYPKVELGKWPTDKVKKQDSKPTQEELDNALKELAKMMMKEEVVDRAAEKGDKTLVDFDVLVAGVPIEGGSSKDYPVVIGEGKMIPGFEDQLIGMKAGDKKDFKLNFPKEYKPDLAGKEADFKIGLNQVLVRTAPEINDEFAKRVGMDTKADLLKKLEENITNEKSDKNRQRAEIEAVKKVVDAAKIGDLPEKMVHDEIHRLLHEFEHDLSHQGIDMQTYLKGIGKNAGELEKEFEPRAIERLKTSMVVEEVAETEKLQVNEKEVDVEWEKQKKFYENQPDVLAQVKARPYRDHLRLRMMRIKAVELIASRLVE